MTRFWFGRQALGSAMDKLRATIDLESEGLTLDEVSPTRRLDLVPAEESRFEAAKKLSASCWGPVQVSAEWRMAVFASREYHTLRRRPEWMALDIVAQSLWQVNPTVEFVSKSSLLRSRCCG